MKLTKSQLKQIIKEELTDEDIKFLMNGFQPIFARMEQSEKNVDRIKREVHGLHKDYRQLNGDVQAIEDNLLTVNDKLSIKKPSRFAEPEAEQEWDAESTTDTNPGGRRPKEDTNTQLEQIIRDEVEEAVKKKELNEGLKEIVLAFLMGTTAMLPTTDEAWAAETKENPVVAYDKILSDVKIPEKKRKQALHSFLKFKEQTNIPNLEKQSRELVGKI